MELDENLDGFDLAPDDSEVDEAFANAFRRAEGGDTEPQAEATPAEEAAATEEEEQPATEEPEEPAADDEVSQFLAKYGGDPEKALRGALELDKLRGRQTDELGQLRQELAEVRAAQQAQPAPTGPTIPITAEYIEALDAAALENPRAALEQAAQVDPSGQLAARVMDTWFAVNPRDAAAFQGSLMVRQAEERLRAEFGEQFAGPLAEHQQSEQDKAFLASWETARAEVAKTGAEMNDLAPQIQATLEGNEALSKAIVNAETTEERAALLKLAYDTTAATSAARKDAEEAAAQEARAEETAAKKVARVVKPSAVGSAPGKSETTEQTEDDRIKAGILGARSTDILSGLTTE